MKKAPRALLAALILILEICSGGCSGKGNSDLSQRVIAEKIAHLETENAWTSKITAESYSINSEEAESEKSQEIKCGCAVDTPIPQISGME
jgi:hypothetical protein